MVTEISHYHQNHTQRARYDTPVGSVMHNQRPQKVGRQKAATKKATAKKASAKKLVPRKIAISTSLK